MAVETQTLPKPFVIETAGAARFVEAAARQAGKAQLAERAGAAVLHLTNTDGLYKGKREDVTRILDDDDRIATGQLLTQLVQRGGVMAAAAEAVLVELTDSDTFWAEINEAKMLAHGAGVPDSPRNLELGFYATGPISAVDLPRVG